MARIPKLQQDMLFIRALREAHLDDGIGLKDEALERLRNPPSYPATIDDPCVNLALSMFLALEHSSEEAYADIRTAVHQCFPGSDIPSLYQVKKILTELSGVVSVVDHMCPNTCVAFVGPYADRETCPECGTHRYDQIKLLHSQGKVKSPKAVFHTIPIGPQLQALWRDPDSARQMHYRRERTQEVFEELRRNDGLVDAYDDIFTGSAYLNAVQEGQITENDMVIMVSLDGAQLYESKESDCWIYIWIITELSPDHRYKKKHVLPGGIIPGPNKPKFIESFLFPGFHHLSALQKEGLNIWDASRDTKYISYLYLILGLADGPGLLALSNLVGHTGRYGCRMQCGLQGRRKPGAPHYYPVLLKPDNYEIRGCDHDDIDVYNLPIGTSANYCQSLRLLMGSHNQAQYEHRRLVTGIVGPSLLLGLHPDHILGIPECFSSEIMHFAGANMAALFTDLWRGEMACGRTDNKADWPWFVLKGDTWEAHGAAVAALQPHLPGSFGRPPRNPAEKINTYYKAQEYITWLFGYGPGIFYDLIPDPYYRNFCQFVRGLRLMSQYSITPDQAREACECFAEWEREFEEIYYQRRVDRIHFTRPCVHLSNHLASECTRIGSPICSSQWTMERTIGNLGQEIRQPSNPFSNLAQQGIRRCQVNALKAILPRFSKPENLLPQGACDVGESFVLLRKCDKRPITLPPGNADTAVISAYLGRPTPKFRRWARLQLPNGQIVRSAWREKLKPPEKIRISRNVKVQIGGVDRFAEVMYFAQLAIRNNQQNNTSDSESDNEDGNLPRWRFATVALVSVYSLPHDGLLTLSHNTLWSCTYHGNDALCVIDVKSIQSVVLMAPHCLKLPSGVEEDRFFVVEKPGLDIARVGVVNEDEADSDDDEED
ncbi:hypothetical protein M405DRAFT_792718 [Rhizopogon salebrosus TDB-379]|nr:hypothetical protein M405DRAFT_792718 [Rhizopogon salebrosus TDB-379]